MRSMIRIVLVGVLFAMLVWGCERKTTEEITQTQIVTPGSASYVGSSACKACHSEIYTDFRKTGHPYKLNTAADAQDPTYYPFSTVQNPPTLPWSQVDLVIGGFWWKARFIRSDGKIYTGPDKQYNMRLDPNDPASPEFVKYETATDSVKNYTCGVCHTTGYSSGGNQSGKPGLIGTWAENGVTCEACHGPGGLHVGNPTQVDMTIDRSNHLCGSCHVRGAVSEIPASGGFIRHHEQWNEMFRTKHATLDCVTCHDPHKGLHPLNPDRASAIRVHCEDCHWKQAQDIQNSALPHFANNVQCIDCHMAKAAKSAAIVLAPYKADVHSHTWRINPDQNADFLNGAGDKANGYLTTDYVCMPCHPTKSRGELETGAALIH